MKRQPGSAVSGTPIFGQLLAIYAARAVRITCSVLHEPEIFTDRPTQTAPETPARPVSGEEEQVAFGNSVSPQSLEATCHQLSSDPASAPLAGNGKVVQIAAAAIVPAKDGSNHPAARRCGQAETGVSLEKTAYGFQAVGFAKADSLGPQPERVYLGVVRDAHGADSNRGFHGAACRNAAWRAKGRISTWKRRLGFRSIRWTGFPLSIGLHPARRSEADAPPRFSGFRFRSPTGVNRSMLFEVPGCFTPAIR